MYEFSIVESIKDAYPVSTISLVLITSGFFKVMLACGLVLRFQERRIKFLEKLIEENN